MAEDPAKATAKKLGAIAACLGTALVIWFMNPPQGLGIQGWHLFSIFIAVIVGIILKPIPMGSLAVIALTMCTLTKTLTIQEALSSFSSKTVWLIVIAFLLARGFIKTGLGPRVAYYFVYYLGKNTIGLAYGLQFTELMLAPFVPSNTARGAGIVFPIVNSLSKEYENNSAYGEKRKIGGYLMAVCFHANVVTSTMFMTAMAANPLIGEFAEQAGVALSWTMWAQAALVPGLICLALLPLIIFWILPPEIKKTPTAKSFARDKLEAMGVMKREEWIMIATFAVILVLWIFGSYIQIDATSAAFVGLSILLLTGVLSWDDILSEKNAWNTFIWLTILLMMTNQLARLGMMTWFSGHIHNLVLGFEWPMALLILSLVYFYSHYLFASLTAHVTTMYAAFVGVGVLAGVPPVLVVLILAFLSNLSAGLTHYGTGTAPVYFGADYVGVKDWWRVGGLLSVIHIFIWLIIGGSWWKLLGFW